MDFGWILVVLGVSWAPLGASCGRLGASWTRLGAIWGVLGRLGGVLGPQRTTCGRLGVSWRHPKFGFPAKWSQIDAFHLGKQFLKGFLAYFSSQLLL